jgi:hypothetical protein
MRIRSDPKLLGLFRSGRGSDIGTHFFVRKIVPGIVYSLFILEEIKFILLALFFTGPSFKVGSGTGIIFKLAVFGIRDILVRVRIRIRGSIPMNNGTESFLQWLKG